MNVYSLVRCMQHVVVGVASAGPDTTEETIVSHEVVVRVVARDVWINHYLLFTRFRFPHYSALNLRSPWITFFARKFAHGQFTFAGDVAGHIVSGFLTSDERFAVWDAVCGLPESITQCERGLDRSRVPMPTTFNVDTRGTYHYKRRRLVIDTRDKSPFTVSATLPPEVAEAFGQPESQ